MSLPSMSLRDRRFIQLYDDYKYACERYERDMEKYIRISNSPHTPDKAKLMEERLIIAKEVMKDAEKEFIEFAKVNKK
jgi:hypothetical protein